MRTLNEHYRQKYGCKVYKLSLDAGMTCPNRDGTVGTGGCIFCSGFGSGEFAEGGPDPIAVQLERAKERVRSKAKDGRYIAYFQSFTNTYAPVEVLESRFRQAMEVDDIVALAIGTRPDCLGDDVIELLSKLNQEIPIYVELGLQTMHENSISYIRRGYENRVYLDAVKNLKSIGVHVITHLILGLPHETAEQMVQSTKYAVDAGTDGVKFHLLHVLKNTDLARDYQNGRFSCLTMEEYAHILKQCIDILPPHIVVHRLTGDGAKRDLIAPLWSADKKRVLNYINKILAKQ